MILFHTVAGDGIYFIAAEDVDLAIIHDLAYFRFGLLLSLWCHRDRGGDWFLEGEIKIALISH